MSIDKELLEHLMKGLLPGDLFSETGILSEPIKALAERTLSTELDLHLDAERSLTTAQSAEPAPNRGNGSRQKMVTTDSGRIVLDSLRDRNGTSNPRLIAKYQRHLPEFDRKIIRHKHVSKGHDAP